MYENSPAKSSKGRKKDRDTFVDEDVNEILTKDFDFQANLTLFDKSQVFDEIRGIDHTDPSARLVALNKLSSKAATKVSPTQPQQQHLVGWKASPADITVPSVTSMEMDDIYERHGKFSHIRLYVDVNSFRACRCACGYSN